MFLFPKAYSWRVLCPTEVCPLDNVQRLCPRAMLGNTEQCSGRTITQDYGALLGGEEHCSGRSNARAHRAMLRRTQQCLGIKKESRRERESRREIYFERENIGEDSDLWNFPQMTALIFLHKFIEKTQTDFHHGWSFHVVAPTTGISFVVVSDV